MKLKFRLTPFQKLQFKFMCLVVIYIRNSNSRISNHRTQMDIQVGTDMMGSEFEKWDVE